MSKRESERLEVNDRQAQAPELIAFYGDSGPSVRIEPALRWRAWMNETRDRWANRCLPLLVANESGWALLNPLGFEATWGGASHPSSVTIAWAGDAPLGFPPVSTYFGYGTLTWTVPYLFRTSPGYNLLARGPANWPKDGVCALEGLVETDWSVATFTMNWKITRPNHPVSFAAGEPFCMIVPQRRGELESFRPELRSFGTEPELTEATKQWVEGRREAGVRKFLSRYAREFEADQTAWQGHYFRGITPDGTAAPEHQTKLNLAPFVERET
jgi:hypothetical protein